MKKVETSLIIPAYQAGATLPAVLESIRRQSEPPEQLIVVDSGPESSCTGLRGQMDGLKILRVPDRLLPGAARNLGASRAEGTLLAFLDADAQPSPHWLSTLKSRWIREKNRPAVGGSLANANPQGLASCILYWIEFSDYLPGLPPGPRSVLSSSNLLVNRQAFLASGGFPEGMAMAEDLAWSYRMGGELFFEPAAQVWHRHREQWLDVLRHLGRLGYWSGRLRRVEERAPGAFLRHFPSLSFLLPLWRLPRILGRLRRHDPEEARRALRHLRPLLKGLFVWGTGFYRGLTLPPPPP